MTVKNETWAQQLRARLDGLNIAYDGKAPELLAQYHALLCEWNQHLNLVGDTDFEIALDRHYVDSLAPLATQKLFPIAATVIDVGTGAGFPGLPLAIARPDLSVTLLDSLQKRLAFLSVVIDALHLTNVRLVHARAEDGGQDGALRERYDVAVARAVAPFPVLCEMLLPFVRVGGHMVCYKGPAAQHELATGAVAAQILGGNAPYCLPVTLPSQLAWQHCLLISQKNQKTLRQYPRKAGSIGKTPLGASGTGRA